MFGINEVDDSDYMEYLGKEMFKDCRYQVELPFIEDHPFLADNFTLCKKRLEKVKERFDKDEGLKAEYNKIIMNQLDTGVKEGYVTYLPHRDVIKEGKSTTKVRVVYDGSAKRKDYVSLNEVLYKGPFLNSNFLDLLLKFRIHPVAMTADLEKAYLQVSIAEKDRNYLRFL